MPKPEVFVREAEGFHTPRLCHQRVVVDESTVRDSEVTRVGGSPVSPTKSTFLPRPAPAVQQGVPFDTADSADVLGSGVALFAERSASGIASKLCLGSTDGSGILRTAGAGSGLGAQERPSDGPLRLVGRVQIWSYGGETLSAAFGASDPSVAKVVVSRASGGDVTATVKDGYWVAWWPGEAAAQEMASFAADGSEVKTIAVEAIAR